MVYIGFEVINMFNFIKRVGGYIGNSVAGKVTAIVIVSSVAITGTSVAAYQANMLPPSSSSQESKIMNVSTTTSSDSTSSSVSSNNSASSISSASVSSSAPSSVSSQTQSSSEPDSSTTGNKQIDDAVTAGVKYIKSVADSAAEDAASKAINQINQAKNDNTYKPGGSGTIEQAGGTKVDSKTTSTQTPKN